MILKRWLRHKATYFIFAYLILLAGISFLLYSRYEALTHDYMTYHMHEFDRQIQSYHLMEQQTIDSYYELFFNSNQVAIIMEEAAHSSPAVQAIYRRELEGRTEEAFASLKQFNIRILFFHLPDQIAFLRVHTPEKFGDSLTASRPSIVKVQTEKKKLVAFETGKLFDGFRTIYPIFHGDKFVGSVEIAYPFLALKKQALRQSSGAYTFLVKRSIQEEKSKTAEMGKHYQESPFGLQYLEDKESSLESGLTGFTRNELNSLLRDNKKNIQNALKQEKLQAIKLDYEGKHALMVLKPVNEINGKHAAYMIEITPDHTFFAEQFEQLIMLLITIALLITLSMLYIYRYAKSITLLNLSLLKAQEAEKIKSSFMANMSHEIRTPLNGIVGFIQLLSKSSLDSTQRRYISIIENSIDTLMQIVNDILDFSKIQEGKVEIELVEINPKTQFDAVFSLFMIQARSKNINYHLTLDPKLHECLKLDIFRLKQVIGNLINNALKFSSQGASVYVTIEVVDDTLTHQTVQFSVIDTGIGISRDKQAKIFEKFTQADSSTTRQFGGTGLGLSISYAMVELMGGVLQVESEEGQGSTFGFKLKIEKCTTAVNPSDVMEHQNSSSMPQPYLVSVLVAEDHDINQMLIDELLRHHYEIKADFADNGGMAVEMVNKKRYDLVLMDVNMPVMDGMEAARIIRESHPELPIIALTANALEGDRERFISAGMNDYLAKPLDVSALHEVLIRYGRKENFK